MITKSTKDGWTKTGKGEYTHVSKIIVKKQDCGFWQIVGGEHDGEAYVAMWVAMHRACKTGAVFANRF